MKKREFSMISAGVVILLLSLWLVFSLHYKHFYEVMLIGLFLILCPLTSKYFTKRTFVILLLISILGGLVSDLLFGLILGEVWYYNYAHIWEYALLYLLVYPLGGFVMVMSFLVFIRDYKLKEDKSAPLNILKMLSILFIVLFAVFIFLKYAYHLPYSGFFIVTFFCFSLLLCLNYLSEKLFKFSYFRILLSNPQKVITATLLGTYINGLLHEYPNLFVDQWVYQNIIFQGITLLGVPVAVLIGWIVLTMYPVSAYYLALMINKKFSKKIKKRH